MFLSALLYEVKGLGSEGKYFLVRFVQCFGKAEPDGLGVKALAKEFGLSDRQVTASLEALVTCKVMEFSSSSEGKGRPKRCYRLTDDFHKKLNKADAQSATQHETAVGSLLKHENKKAGQANEKIEEQNEGVDLLADARRKRQPGKLSVVNRLLLSVLLCRADRFGVVSDLGSSELCKVVGLDQKSLKHRMRRLIDQGLIRTYVPGATSSVLFAKMKSIYFLNLNHPELIGGGISVLACIPAFPSHNVWHASSIERRAHRLKGQIKPSLGHPYYLLRDQQRSFFQFLQVMLETCAAHFLSRYWSKLVQVSYGQRIEAQDIPALNRNDFWPPNLPLDYDGDEYDILLEDLYRFAYILAVTIKGLLSQASHVPFETMDFVIIPQRFASDYACITLLALPRDADGWRSCLVIDPCAGPQYFFRESEIPLEGRYRLGLLTPPGSKVKST